MTGTMHRETLRSCLNNAPLVQAISQKQKVHDTREKLWSASQILRETGFDTSVIDAVQQKCKEYSTIVRGYDSMIESVWGLSWQDECLIEKYMDCNDDDIDKLPEYVQLN